VEEERREQADERRLPGAVLAQDRDALAALDRERDVFQRGDAAAALGEDAAVLADELLAQVVDFDGEQVLLLFIRGNRLRRSATGRASPAGGARGARS
jgi:hypothetical protein